MKKRIGNDISFVWHIYRKSGDTQVPESFAGKDVTIKLISPLQRPVTIEDVSIATGVVTFTFRGKHQVTLGNYVAILQENKGEDGMVTIDVVNAVTLVPHSYMEEDGDDGDVIEATSVELTSEIGQGIDAYTKAETDALLEGKYDKVDGIRFLAGQRWIVVQDENGKATTTISPTEVQFEEENGTQSAEIWLNGGYLRLNDKYHTSPTGNKIATDLELAGKQDTINDLAAIRSGAQAGSTAVQPADLTQIDNRLDDVEYCLGDYLKDTYVFNWENHTTTTTEPIYTTRELYTVDGGSGFQTCDCRLTAGSAIISALYLGGLGSGTMYFTQAGTVTMYLVLDSNPSSTSRLIQVYDASGNSIEIISTYDIPYNSQHICTPITFEVEAGYCLKISTTSANAEKLIWLGQIDFEIAGVKQIDKDVHANSAAIEVIEQKIPAQASSSNKLVDKNSLASVATSGSYNDLSDKPDLSAFITNSVDDLVNYYLKSETYTKAEVQQLIGAIQQFHYEVYPTLPQTGASNVLYLIGPTGTGTDKYEEYVYANNDWTKIGDTSIDLSGYVTTQALNTALADYVTSSALSTTLANYYNKTEVDGLFAGKENVMPITTATGATLSAVVGNYYRLDNVGTLAITLPTIVGATKLQAITFLLGCGSSALVTFAPQGSETILYQEDFVLEADTTYEVTALWNSSEWTLSRVIYE